MQILQKNLSIKYMNTWKRPYKTCYKKEGIAQMPSFKFTSNKYMMLITEKLPFVEDLISRYLG